MAIFFDKMWVALKRPKRAGNSVVAFGGSEKSRLVTASARSDVSLLLRRLVVVAPTRQWLCRWRSVECLTKSQWGAAWGQLCHALQACKLVPAWDPKHGSSDVVLDADTSPWGCLEAENSDASASCQLPRYFIGLPRPHNDCLCLASISTSLPRSRLGW